MKILIRGGSIAAGYGVKRGYADILKSDYNSGKHEVINCSRAKETSFDGLDSFFEDIDSLKPDLLMLHFGIDDAFFPVYRSEFKENLVHIVRMATERFNPDVVLLTSHLFDNPYEMEADDIYYRVIREVSIDLGCAMIPIHTYWAGYLFQNCLNRTDLLQQDSRYPNEWGHSVYAEAIIHWLSSRYDIGGFTINGPSSVNDTALTQ
jgi:hypothetical protein